MNRPDPGREAARGADGGGPRADAGAEHRRPAAHRTLRIALAGDTMLGRGVADRLASTPPASLFADEVVAAAHEADLFVLNLECAVSDRGSPWPDPFKPFFFRAPPVAVEALGLLGVGCVTLANNHALDFGAEALADTRHHLAAAGITAVGAGPDQDAARAPAVLERRGVTVGVVGVADHPRVWAAGEGRPGIAYADLEAGTPRWLLDTVSRLRTDVVLVTPHWGPNMVARPVRRVRSAARDLRAAGATLVAGHSAHVFHGVEDHVLYDLGDFMDDYVTDPLLRNDLGLLFLVTVEVPDEGGGRAPEAGTVGGAGPPGGRPVRLEALPLALDFCHTRPARAAERRWIARRFRSACAAFGTEVAEEQGRLVVGWA